MEEEEGEGVAVPEAVKVEVVQRLVEATTVEGEGEVVVPEDVEVEVVQRLVEATAVEEEVVVLEAVEVEVAL